MSYKVNISKCKGFLVRFHQLGYPRLVEKYQELPQKLEKLYQKSY